jgi:hypothetical protein
MADRDHHRGGNAGPALARRDRQERHARRAEQGRAHRHRHHVEQLVGAGLDQRVPARVQGRAEQNQQHDVGGHAHRSGGEYDGSLTAAAPSHEDGGPGAVVGTAPCPLTMRAEPC